jgi:multisubunit Na+/H+ antiporter MnhE subunit
MLTDQKFWVGVIVGLVLFWVYRNYLAKRMQG